MALQKSRHAGDFRTPARRDDRPYADPARRIHGPARTSGKTRARKVRGFGHGLRLFGIGVLLMLPLGVLVSLLPRGENEPELAPPPAVRDAFAARWPSDSGPGVGSSIKDDARPGQPAAQTAAAGIGTPQRNRPSSSSHATLDPAMTANGTLTAGVVGSGPEWNAYALGAPKDTAPKFQTASSRQTDPRFQSQTRPSQDGGPLAKPKTELVEFGTAPFPYEGVMPGSEQPFLNVVNGTQKGHRTSRGSVLWEDETFSDSRVLLHIPSGFNINNPAVMVVFFHGHGANLSRDVLNRQKLPQQISLSGMNAVLVAPQFAVNAANSSPGRFWLPGGFARFVDEAGKKLAGLYGNPAKAKQFANMPVILVAYSGGYLPASWTIRNGGVGSRLRGVVLLDALYGEIDNFAKWIKSSPSVFFISAYTSSTRRQNLELANILSDENVPYSNEIGRNLWRGRVAILPTSSEANHRDFVTHAWTSNPIADILAKLN